MLPSCPFHQLASPPGFHVTHISKGNLAYSIIDRRGLITVALLRWRNFRVGMRFTATNSHQRPCAACRNFEFRALQLFSPFVGRTNVVGVLFAGSGIHFWVPQAIFGRIFTHIGISQTIIIASGGRYAGCAPRRPSRGPCGGLPPNTHEHTRLRRVLRGSQHAFGRLLRFANHAPKA